MTFGWRPVGARSNHYGLAEREDLVNIFVAVVPVAMDVLFKFWVFKYLRDFSPDTQVPTRGAHPLSTWCPHVRIWRICSNLLHFGLERHLQTSCLNLKSWSSSVGLVVRALEGPEYRLNTGAWCNGLASAGHS